VEPLVGKIALVTGAGRGIGKAVALALAQEGADVAVHYRTNHTGAMEACSTIEGLGRRALAVRADVSRADHVARLIASVEKELGVISILVNNAGIARAQPLEDITEKDWEEVLAVNLKSMFLTTQAVLPGLRARHWGRVINLSSIAAHVGGGVGPHYAASKAAIVGLTHFYAALLAKEGITVNAIAPALIDTGVAANNVQAQPQLIPVGRYGHADEVADAVVMLARNGYITGQTINVNGGCYMS
jgi:3-oxoacyl-[acyl-carrier protein] reductase